MASNGVSGLAANPTLSPSSRIWAISSAVRPTSTCTVQPSAPASRNGSRYRAGSVIIRWVSKNRSVCSRSDETTGGPMVRLGTKRPSMTSTWSHSEPGAIWSTAFGQASEVGRQDRRGDAAARGVRSGSLWRVSLPGEAAHTPSRSPGAGCTPCSQSVTSIGRRPSGCTVTKRRQVPPPATTSAPSNAPGGAGSAVGGRHLPGLHHAEPPAPEQGPRPAHPDHPVQHDRGSVPTAARAQPGRIFSA